MTIAEKLAAKNRKQAPAPVADEDVELEDAMKRINIPKLKPLVLGTSVDKGRMEPSPDLPIPADDCDWVIFQEKDGKLWLSMPCADPTHPPVKIIQLPWRMHSSNFSRVADDLPF